MLRKFLTVAAVVFVIWYVASQPAHGAATVSGILHWLNGTANHLAAFVSKIH